VSGMFERDSPGCETLLALHAAADRESGVDRSEPKAPAFGSAQGRPLPQKARQKWSTHAGFSFHLYQLVASGKMTE